MKFSHSLRRVFHGNARGPQQIRPESKTTYSFARNSSCNTLGAPNCLEDGLAASAAKNLVLSLPTSSARDLYATGALRAETPSKDAARVGIGRDEVVHGLGRERPNFRDGISCVLVPQ